MVTASDTTDLSDLLDQIDPLVLGIPEQRWDGPKGHKRLCRYLVEGPLTTGQLRSKQGGGDVELLRQRLRDLRRTGIIDSQRQYLSATKEKGPYRNVWLLLPDSVKAKAQEQSRSKSLIDHLRVDQQRLLHEADWGARGNSDHAAWRLAEMCAAYEKNPTIATTELTLLLVADKATVNRWRRDLFKIGFLRNRKLGDKIWVEVQWKKITAAQNSNCSGRILAPTRAVTRLSERSPKEDRRTEEQRQWCDVVEASDLGLEGYVWGAAKVLAASIGTTRYTTREELAAELGGGRKSIDRILPDLKKEDLLTVVPHSGGDSGRKSKWTWLWSKVEQAAREKLKASTNGTAGTNGTAIAAKPKTAAKSTGRPSEWKHLKEWIMGRGEFVESQHSLSEGEVRKNYRSKFPDRKLPPQKSSTIRVYLCEARKAVPEC